MCCETMGNTNQRKRLLPLVCVVKHGLVVGGCGIVNPRSVVGGCEVRNPRSAVVVGDSSSMFWHTDVEF